MRIMRRNESFILRKTADLTVILPVGEASVRFPGMISVNETGAFLWEALEKPHSLTSLVAELTRVYEVEPEQAEKDTDVFLEQLRRAGALVEE